MTWCKRTSTPHGSSAAFFLLLLSGCATPCARSPSGFSLGLETDAGLVDPDLGPIVLEERGDERGVHIGWWNSGANYDRIMRRNDLTALFRVSRATGDLSIFETEEWTQPLEMPIPECTSAAGAPARYEQRDVWIPFPNTLEGDLLIVEVSLYYQLKGPYTFPTAGIGFTVANEE